VSGVGDGLGVGRRSRLTRPPDDLLLQIASRRGASPIRNGRGAKTTLVLLVRHGQTSTTGTILPGRAPGLHLADKGREEAKDVAARIAALPRVAAVYASPLERAQETAAPIAAATGVPVTVDPGLLECDYGEWTGLALKDLRKKPEWRTVQRYPSGFRFPGGESFIEMQARVTGTLARLVDTHPGDTIVAVSHADPIRTAVAHALGTHLDLFQRIVVFTASVTAIAYGAGGPTVLAVNATGGDLAPLAGS
jgi:probable phosphomutase (TIGR03848 family)